MESISSHGQRTHRVGATLIAITWIVGAHSGREGVESGVDGVGIGGEQPPEDLGETVSVAPDRQFPIAAALTTTPHRVTIGASDHLVDVSTDAALRNTAPASDFRGQRCINGRQHIGVGNQIGAIDDRLERPVVDVAGQQHVAHPRQP